MINSKLAVILKNTWRTSELQLDIVDSCTDVGKVNLLLLNLFTNQSFHHPLPLSAPCRTGYTETVRGW